MHAVHELNESLPAVTTTQAVMQAIVQRVYGEPEVLSFEQVERPVPAPNEVLVKVFAAGVNVGDHHVITGKPYLIRLSPFGGLPGPRNKVPGQCLAGRIESVGAKVTGFKVGDEVFGQADTGAFAEYVVVKEQRLALKPKNFSFEEAAALPWATTPLQGLRDVAGLKPGQRLLINGASGGVGTWAVQLGKALGAHVTAVCSTRNVELVRGLGADEVIDYTKEDFVAGGARFDVMFDVVGNRTLAECRSVLKADGIFVPCSGGGGDWVGPFFRILAGLFTSMFTSRRFKTFVNSPNQEDLVFLKELVEAGKGRPVIERQFPLSQVGDALRHIGEGHARGQSVIRVSAA